MRLCRPQPLLRALCAVLCIVPLLTGVAADAAAAAPAPGDGSIGVPILQSDSAGNGNATDEAGSTAPAAAAPAANATRPQPAAASPEAPAAEPTAPAPAPAAGAAAAAAPELDAGAPEAGEAPGESPGPAEAPTDDDSGAVSEDEEAADGEEAGIDAADVEEADDREQGFGGRLPVDLESPTLIDAFNLEGGLIAEARLSRFQERICSTGLECDSAIAAAMMVVAAMAGAFVVTHVAAFLPEIHPKEEPRAVQVAETLSSAATAVTQSSVYRAPSNEQYHWPHFCHLYRTRERSRLRLGFSWAMLIPALMWAAVSFGTSFVVTPSEAEFRLQSPVYLAVTDAADWGAVRFDGCNDIAWRVSDGISPLALRRTVRRCYDARRLASTEVPPSRLSPPGAFASMLITSDHVRVAVLYENGPASTISRVSARVVDLTERQPPPLAALRGGVNGGRTDASGTFLSSRVRPEALIPYFEAAMRQEQYAECGPPSFSFIGDDLATFSGRWTFTCSPQRGAALGVDGLLLAVFLRHTEYRIDPDREGEPIEVFVPVRGVAEAAGEVIEVVGIDGGLLIGEVGVIWCNWLCSVVAACVALTIAAIVAVLAAFFAQNLPVL